MQLGQPPITAATILHVGECYVRDMSLACNNTTQSNINMRVSATPLQLSRQDGGGAWLDKRYTYLNQHMTDNYSTLILNTQNDKHSTALGLGGWVSLENQQESAAVK